MNKNKEEFYREILLNKLRELHLKVKERRIEGIREFDEVEPDIYDFCVQLYSKEQFFSLCERERRILAMVEDALKKMKANTYGLCEECEQPINEKRLEALPWVKLCIQCQSERERGIAA
jgi:DnaK suppressor protein